MPQTGFLEYLTHKFYLIYSFTLSDSKRNNLGGGTYYTVESLVIRYQVDLEIFEYIEFLFFYRTTNPIVCKHC